MAKSGIEPAFSDLPSLLNDTLHHSRELARAEVELAKAELRVELARAKSAVLALVVGGCLLASALAIATVGLLTMLGADAGQVTSTGIALLVLSVLLLLWGRQRLVKRALFQVSRSSVTQSAALLKDAMRSPAE